MRPKLLEIEGLQSFTDNQTIDFDALGETGLFGIFGPTGSGKSTILDAITFALYGRVKRAEGGTQGIINSSRNTARVCFTFELEREGTRKTYRAERTYQRKKNSPNACEPKVARLIEVTGTGDIPLCDKATEVSNYVRDLLGLGNDDFTRAVVLPQNSFQEFLLLNNSERRGMLERIFYLEEYGKRLWDKLGRKMAKLKSSIDILSGELLGYADASDDALAEAEKAMKAAASEKSRVEKELKLLEAKYTEAKEVWGLVQELADFNRKQEEHLASSTDIDLLRLQLDKAAKADSLIEMIKKNRELNEKVQQTQNQLRQTADRLSEAAAELETARARYEALKKEAEAEQPGLVSRRTRLSDALGILSEISALSAKLSVLSADLTRSDNDLRVKNEQISMEISELEMITGELGRLGQEIGTLKIDPEYRQHIQEGMKLENEANALEGSVGEYKEKLASLRSSAAGLDERLDSIRAEIKASLKAYELMDTQKQQHEALRPGDKNNILKALDRIHGAAGTYQILKLRKSELDQLGARLEMLKTSRSDAEKKVGELNEALLKAGGIYEQRRQEMDGIVAEVNRNAALALSRELTDGKPCPVCGSACHPSPAFDNQAGANGCVNRADTERSTDTADIESALNNARERLAASEAAFKTAERNSLVMGEQLKTIEDQVAGAERELIRKTAEYEEERQKLPEKLRLLELELVFKEVEKASTNFSEKLDAIEAWEKRLEEYKEELLKLKDDISTHRLAENGISTELKVNSEGFVQMENALARTTELLTAAKKKYTDFLQQYGISSAAAEMKRLSANDLRLYQLQKDMDKQNEASSKKRTVIEGLREELRLLNAGRMKLETEMSGIKGQKLNRESIVRELAGDGDIGGEIVRIDARLDEYAERGKEYSRTAAELEKTHHELSTQKTLLENQFKIYSENLKNDQARVKAGLNEKGFSDEAEAEDSVIPRDKQKVMRDMVENYDQTMVNIKAQKALIQKKLNSRSITEDDWNRTNASYIELVSYKQECASNSEVAKSNYASLNKKHGRWVELCSSHSELSRKQGLYEQIQKILKAEHRKDNSFIDFIAEERLRYVAANASITLGVMTGHRYTLELDTEAGFIIRDQANGGVHRMVTSLSGGETFLTSLSLALALSEQIQLKGQSPLEFFFLDEGFGTLDQDLLDAVIDSLERLSSNERVIGLISHVPELKSRMARRIVVEPPSVQGEGSRVRIEKA